MSVLIGRNDGLGIIMLLVNLVYFLIIGEIKFIDWGVFLVLGIFIGLYIVVRGLREFKW